jgi:hypothetical protein
MLMLPEHSLLHSQAAIQKMPIGVLPLPCLLINPNRFLLRLPVSLLLWRGGCRVPHPHRPNCRFANDVAVAVRWRRKVRNTNSARSNSAPQNRSGSLLLYIHLLFLEGGIRGMFLLVPLPCMKCTASIILPYNESTKLLTESQQKYSQRVNKNTHTESTKLQTEDAIL